MKFPLKTCSNIKYERLRDSCFTSVNGCASQENVTFLGVLIACSQPDMISENTPPQDLCWCRSLFNIGVK